MRLTIFLFFILIGASYSCETIHINPSEADCLKKLIRNSTPKVNEVYSYFYNGNIVYLVIPDCCDAYISLYDKNCNFICAPSGGFTGKGDGKCVDFYDKATNKTLVWKKS